jgi:FkbM family methyltransferase
MNMVSTDNARRILRRARKAAQIGLVAENYVEVWRSVLTGRKLGTLRLRNGLAIAAPQNVQLWNHFNDIWLDQSYTRGFFDIPTGGTVIDVGANIGLFSLLAAQRAARVIAFEPGPCFEWLARNVEVNHVGKIIQPLNSAMGRDAGTRTFLVQHEFTSNSFYQTTGEPVTVACTTLRAAIDEHCGGRCDFLKLDCEGAEFEILLEASDDTLGRIGMIALEVHEGLAGGHSRADIEKRLVAAGFSIEVLPGEGPVILRGRNRKLAPSA